MKKILLYMLLLMANQTLLAQQTILLSDGSIVEGIQETIPTRDVEETDSGIIVTYEFNKVVKHDDLQSAGSSFLSINGFGYYDIPSQPCTLFRWDSFSVPKNIMITVSVIDSSYIEFPLRLSSGRPRLYDSYVSYDNYSLLPNNNNFSNLIIPETRSSSYRNMPIFDVCVCPIQYDSIKNIVRCYKRIVYRISYHNSGIQDIPSLGIPISDDGDTFLDNTTLNGGSPLDYIPLENNSYYSGHPSTPNYIIVTTPTYYDAANRFADWKSILGYKVTILTDSVWTPIKIKQSIPYSYVDNYMLIIGDHQDVPSDTITVVYKDGTRSTYYTDYPYTYGITEEEIIPNTYCGRLPVSSLEEAQNAINKIIEYEQNPCQDDSFYKMGLNCAEFSDDIPQDGYEDRRFVLTSEEIRNFLLSKGFSVTRVYNKTTGSTPTNWNSDIYSYGELIPDSLQVGNFNWNGGLNDIVNTLNQGPLYVLYRGHGLDIGWSNPPFNTPLLDRGGISDFNNHSRYPVVFSLTCHTGDFTSPNICLLEKLIRCQNGCVAAFGATDKSDTGGNDGLAEGIFDSLWPNSGLIPIFPHGGTGNNYGNRRELRLGKLLSQAMRKMGTTWLYTIPNVYLYHCFGDPSMRMYTEKPTPISGVSIIRSSGRITVSLSPDLYDATLSFYDREHNDVVSYQCSTGEYFDTLSDSVIVCVSAPNKIPLIDDPSKCYYIQNETLSGNKTIKSDQIKIGHHVTNLKPNGEVVLSGGKFHFIGKEVTLDAGTTIELGTQLQIKNP